MIERERERFLCIFFWKIYKSVKMQYTKVCLKYPMTIVILIVIMYGGNNFLFRFHFVNDVPENLQKCKDAGDRRNVEKYVYKISNINCNCNFNCNHVWREQFFYLGSILSMTLTENLN